MKAASIYNYYSSIDRMERPIEMVKKILAIDCKYDQNLPVSHSQTFMFCTLDGNPYSQHKIDSMVSIIQDIIRFCKCEN